MKQKEIEMHLSGRKRTVTVTFSLDLSASNSEFSAQKCCGLLLADEEAGELWPSMDVSRKCFEEDVVEDEGELAGFELLGGNFLGFDLCLVDIIASNQFFCTLKRKTKWKIVQTES